MDTMVIATKLYLEMNAECRQLKAENEQLKKENNADIMSKLASMYPAMIKTVEFRRSVLAEVREKLMGRFEVAVFEVASRHKAVSEGNINKILNELGA